MSLLDEAEYRRLQEALSSYERLLAENPKLPSSPSTKAHQEAQKQRIQFLEGEGIFGEHPNERKKSTAEIAVAIAELVARENRLTPGERQSYAEFLRHDFFSNADLKKLEEFYVDGGSFDRLSRTGKDEMTIRTLEGINRGELETERMSPTFQRKHADHLNLMMGDPNPHPKISAIPEETRQSFLKSYEEGDIASANRAFSSKYVFGKDPASLSQISTRRVESADQIPNNFEGPSEEVTQKPVEEIKSKSDLEFLSSLSEKAKISPTDLPPKPTEKEPGI